jgi:hypothetical protein
VQSRAGYSVLATATTVAPGGILESTQGFRQLMMWAARGSETVFGAWTWGEVVAGSVTQKLRIYSIAANGTLTNSHEVVTTGGTDQLKSFGEWTNFTALSGTTYLLLCATVISGGVDTFTPKAFDGTSWSAPAITNVPAGTIGVHSHRARLWFYGVGTSGKGLSAWYLPTGAIAGAAVEFNVGPFASRGGRIASMRTWTMDGGDGGLDDYAVFLTDRGQAIVYAGTDPSSSATWQLVGVFNVAYPASAYDIGDGAANYFLKDSFSMKYGADMLFLLADGVNSANRVLKPQVEGGDYTISSKIRPLITDLARSNGLYGTNPQPWKIVYLPARRLLMLSAVTARTSTSVGGILSLTVSGCTAYAMNSETGAWTKFDGLNIWDAMPVGNELYFIDGGQKIYKYGLAADDNGTAITYECRQAYNYLNSPNEQAGADDAADAALHRKFLALGGGGCRLQPRHDLGLHELHRGRRAERAAVDHHQSKYGKAIAAHLKGQTSVGVVSWYATNFTPMDGSFL